MPHDADLIAIGNHHRRIIRIAGQAVASDEQYASIVQRRRLT